MRELCYRDFWYAADVLDFFNKSEREVSLVSIVVVPSAKETVEPLKRPSVYRAFYYDIDDKE